MERQPLYCCARNPWGNVLEDRKGLHQVLSRDECLTVPLQHVLDYFNQFISIIGDIHIEKDLEDRG